MTTVIRSRRRAILSRLLILIGVALLAVPASAQEPESPGLLRADTLETFPEGESVFLLRRATAEIQAGNHRAARQLLEQCDLFSADAFPQADRAAFMLSRTYLRLNDVEAFHALAGRVSSWPEQTAYSRWVVYQMLLLENLETQFVDGRKDLSVSRDLDGFADADALTAFWVFRHQGPESAIRFLDSLAGSGEPRLLYLRGLATEALGTNAEPVWKALAVKEGITPLDRDLIGAAVLKVAAGEMQAGWDPTRLLNQVPEGSRYAAKARYLQGLLREEFGKREQAEEILLQLRANAEPGTLDRDVGIRLGGWALEGMRVGAADTLYREVSDDWYRDLAAVQSLLARENLDSLWERWEAGGFWPDHAGIDVTMVWQLADSLTRDVLDLRRDRDVAGGHTAVLFLPPGESDWNLVPPPGPGERRKVAEASALARQARVHARDAAFEVQDRLEELYRRRDYIDRGILHSGIEDERLSLLEEQIADYLNSLESILARLRDLNRDAEIRFLEKTARSLETARAHLIWIQAMRHLYIEGPYPPERLPQNVPPMAELLDREEELLNELAGWLKRLETRIPELLENSLTRAWTPRFVEQARGLGEKVSEQRDWLNRILATLEGENILEDSLLAALSDRERQLRVTADSLEAGSNRLRDEVARAALERTLAELLVEREEIDYGMASVAYEQSVMTLRGAGDFLTDSTSVATREHARGRLQAFLDAYPESRTRAEVRYRLADLLLARARTEFEESMRRFVEGDISGVGSGAQTFVPVVDVAPALALYRRILKEDTDYPHRDAVLYNLGMILSDEGNPESGTHLTALVTDFPESEFCQEAHVRMGDDAFDLNRYRACIPHYRNAVEGPDPGFTAIALYRMGWAQFSLEDYAGSTDTFRRLLDHYDTGEVNLRTDLRPEAEDYLVHCLVRGGGASFFNTYFSGIGYRKYEKRILQGMASLQRESSLYFPAIESDRLYLERYPEDAEVLVSARRIVDSFELANRGADAREARLKYAMLFVPGSLWFEKNEGDSLRAESQTFARNSMQTVALYHHHRARAGKGGDESWRRALDLYGRLLKIWPFFEEAGRSHLYAGEAAAKLKQYELSIHHYDNAVARLYSPHAEVQRFEDSDLVITRVKVGEKVYESILEANWQRLAVTDEWYRSTADPGTSVGVDSLAVRVRRTANHFLDVHGEDPRAADALWRSANLGFAHGWYVDAAGEFGAMVDRFDEDPRVPRAAALRGDALYRAGEFAEAGDAYQAALEWALYAEDDTLAARIEPVIPLCAFRHAEELDETKKKPLATARAFEAVATDWPDYEHAGLSLYRSGLAYIEAEKTASAVAVWERLIELHPDHEYTKDAHLQIAASWEEDGRADSAALAFQRFSERYPQDDQAGEALLKAADLTESTGDSLAAESIRLSYVDRFPGDHETAMAILQKAAVKELAGLGSEGKVSTLLDGSKSRLSAYLDLAEKNPDMASIDIQARVQFLRGEEEYPRYHAMTLALPIDKSINAKKRGLEKVLALYGDVARHGSAEWSRGATYRIGEALISFGDRLTESERPSELTGDDLAAYDEVLLGEAWGFYEQGEQVWSELIRETRDSADDPGQWIRKTRDALWPRLGDRFYFFPEVNYPLVDSTGPSKEKPSFTATKNQTAKETSQILDEDGSGSKENRDED